MDREIMAIIIKEGSRFAGDLIRQFSPGRQAKAVSATAISIEETVPDSGQEPAGQNTEANIKEGTACLPCTNSHLHACVGLLNEAVRMSRDGINEETIKRTDACLGEIVAAERIDLAPLNISNLPQEEKIIAQYAAGELREIRHDLEGVSRPEQLEQIAARTDKLQKHIGREWFKVRLQNMSKDEKIELTEKALQKLQQEDS